MKKQTETTKIWLAVVCGCLVWSVGCETRKPQAKPVVNFIAVVHPVLPPGAAADLESPPDLSTAMPEPPELGLGRMQPARPHVTPPPAPEPAAEKHVEPTIAPEVTTEEMIAAKTETQRDLDVAERNLTMAQGKSLNATQQDLASKIRGFADNAREAMRTGDWLKAKTFSKKAEVLSEQLVASL
jgi:type IV secretory pathway VirB10-like protein